MANNNNATAQLNSYNNTIQKFRRTLRQILNNYYAGKGVGSVTNLGDREIAISQSILDRLIDDKSGLNNKQKNHAKLTHSMFVKFVWTM